MEYSRILKIVIIIASFLIDKTYCYLMKNWLFGDLLVEILSFFFASGSIYNSNGTPFAWERSGMYHNVVFLLVDCNLLYMPDCSKFDLRNHQFKERK